MCFNLRYLVLFFFLSAIALSTGCSDYREGNCHPLLFPYIEYGYKAETQKLPGIYTQKGEEIIEFHGLKLAVPVGWRYEIVLSGHSVKFYRECNDFFLLSFEKNSTYHQEDIKNFRLIGCDHFNEDKKPLTKTSMDYYTDLFSVTDNDIDSDSGFWLYYILWSKTELFHDSAKLIHYKGNNLEAFQNNIKPKICEDKTVHTHIAVFPQNTAPDYFTIGVMEDDNFFVFFLDMIDTLNP